jgi:hypothetical protein
VISCGTVNAQKYTRSRSTSVGTAVITLAAATHANGTAIIGQPNAECLQVAPEEADKKRRVIQQAHDEYIKGLSEGDTRSFSQIIKEKFPSSSKRP